MNSYDITPESLRKLTTPTIKTMIARMNDELTRRDKEKRTEAINHFRDAFNELKDLGIRVYGVYDYSDQLTFNNWDDFYFD